MDRAASLSRPERLRLALLLAAPHPYPEELLPMPPGHVEIDRRTLVAHDEVPQPCSTALRPPLTPDRLALPVTARFAGARATGPAWWF
jgi:hypothetical protein